jgi:hypothetical protein
MHRRGLAALSSLIALAVPAAAQSCDRAFLIEATNRYVAAQSLGEIRHLRALNPASVYLENTKPVNISTSILAQPLKIDYSRSTHDPVTCATYTEIIVTDKTHPYVIGTQIYYANRTITKIDSLVTDAEDWLFRADHTLYYALQEVWEPVPVDKRDSRATIQAAADAYLNLFKGGPGSIEVPWGENCKRLEGGLYTAPGDDCNSGVPSGIDLVNRRYVIDEVMGAVSVFLSFGGSSLPDSHEFRVVEGKIKNVHTITVCWEPNCGFDAPEQLSVDLGF